jgi:GNAT superfamily N-acetyltransferase
LGAMQGGGVAMEIRRACEGDDEALLGVRVDAGVDLTLRSVVTYRHDVAVYRMERWVAEEDGAIVGGTMVMPMAWVVEAGVWFGELFVAPSRKGAGIGGRLWAVAEARLCEVGAVRVYGEVREGNDRAEGFARRRGFERSGRVDVMSRLSVDGARIDRLPALRERLADAGIVVMSMEEIGLHDEGFLRALHAVEHESEADMPSDEAYGEAKPFDVWRTASFEREDRPPALYFVALQNGRPVGLSRYKLGMDGALQQGFTGVARSHRGRGVAQLLKMEGTRRVREGGYRWIYTGNDATNTAMLAINAELGFERLPVGIEVVRRGR